MLTSCARRASECIAVLYGMEEKPMNRLLGALAAAVLMTAPVLAPAQQFRVGAAARITTPDKMMPVSAGGPGDMATEKKGELEVRVMVLDDGKTRVAFMSQPYLGFPATLIKKITDQVTDIPAENVIVGATHTHGGHDPYGCHDM